MIFTCKESRRSNNFIWASLTNEYSSPNNKRNKNEEDGCSVDVVCVRDRLLTFEIAMNGNSSTVKTIVAFLMKHHQRKCKVNLFIFYLKAFPSTWKSRDTKRLIRGIEMLPFIYSNVVLTIWWFSLRKKNNISSTIRILIWRCRYEAYSMHLISFV